MEINGPTDFLFDLVASLAAGAYLFTGDGYAAHSFRCAFHQTINMALTSGTDDHQVVCSMPGGHAHASDIILKTTGGDLSGHHTAWLRVDMLEVL